MFAASSRLGPRSFIRGVRAYAADQIGIVGFNTSLNCCSQFWAGVQTVPVIRGAFNITNKLQYIKDLVTDAKATKTTLSYTIRPDANWNWGGKKIPVTYRDFAYSWQMYVDPKNDPDGGIDVPRDLHGAVEVLLVHRIQQTVEGGRANPDEIEVEVFLPKSLHLCQQRQRLRQAAMVPPGSTGAAKRSRRSSPPPRNSLASRCTPQAA